MFNCLKSLFGPEIFRDQLIKPDLLKEFDGRIAVEERANCELSCKGTPSFSPHRVDFVFPDRENWHGYIEAVRKELDPELGDTNRSCIFGKTTLAK